jgi:adenylate cyclase
MELEFVGDKTVSIQENETILHASLGAGIPHFHSCGGMAKCSTCRVLIVNGSKWLSQPNEKEKHLQEQLQFPMDVRLACQSIVTGGPVRLLRIIRDEADIDLYIGESAGVCAKHLGEEREMTLLFLDIRDFTPFVETHLAFDVIHIIRKLFTILQKHIKNNGGTVIETTGDGLYAVFDFEKDKVKSAQSAVDAAYSMLADLESLNKSYFQKLFGEIIQVGIGIHIGNVVSGAIQLESVDRFIVMGYPVNIAARLQNATKELDNNLIVSADIYGLLFNPPAMLPKAIHVKGVASTLAVYTLGKPYQRNREPVVTEKQNFVVS